MSMTKDDGDAMGKRKNGKNKSFVIWHDQDGELQGMEDWIGEDGGGDEGHGGHGDGGGQNVHLGR